MPELPEVETVVRTLRPQVLECCIERVDVLRERSLHPLSLPVERLAGTRISAARRRGKLALLDLEPPAVAAALPVPSILAVHLRMTGRFMVHPEGAAPLKHTRIIFHLQRPDGSRAQLFFDDVRSFGLVFAATPELLERVQTMGVKVGYVTLHVGLGTFRPVKEEEITDHAMHSEYCVIPQETAELINETRKNGGRVICVGTTSCRTLESHAAEDGTMTASAGWTDIFIYPGYRFKVLDGLITNFHLPESTLIMLVSALAGREHVLAAYQEAVKERYHFFSFGDAMLIL